VSTVLKFARQLIHTLSERGEAPVIALRLYLLAAQISDECGFEDLTYELFVQSMTVYEESISESRGQLQAITLIIGTLAATKAFGVEGYDTLITKAALHGARLLKKSHQASAVTLASHMWWQEGERQPEVEPEPENKPEKTEEKPDDKSSAEGEEQSGVQEEEEEEVLPPEKHVRAVSFCR
jgi:vacuolar protein sorting-associated protein 35